MPVIGPEQPVTIEGVTRLPPEWGIYQDLIEDIPEDIGVRAACVGPHWTYVDAECGLGIALTCPGGTGPETAADPSRLSLKELACQAVSWNFIAASVGVAALNAWYSSPAVAKKNGMVIERKASNDGFDFYHQACTGKKVTVVGHFPMIERLSDVCELTVLERDPHGSDVPDPACEYLVPHQDVLFMTGVTLTNKTMPRLLQLSQKCNTIMVGPSVVPAPVLFDYGVDCLAGSVVTDPERARASIVAGDGSSGAGIFKCGVQKMRLERPGWAL
ncbi:MAG: DUF364 domain-containing protein [Coriobacteriales bacterium]|nr:DUF364 domain-containing protein [Coriobacteriales bacterium]